MTIKNSPPALIPNKSGAASGFLVNACINAPEMARLDPTTVAIKALDNLDVMTMTLFGSDSSK